MLPVFVYLMLGHGVLTGAELQELPAAAMCQSTATVCELAHAQLSYACWLAALSQTAVAPCAVAAGTQVLLQRIYQQTSDAMRGAGTRCQQGWARLADVVACFGAQSGTTACTALLLGTSLYVANVGDTNAVLVSSAFRHARACWTDPLLPALSAM
eukprot:SAG11_NODE_1342_length_5154_cov_2.272404_5_plen_156_part_00